MAEVNTGNKSWETRGMSLRERLLFRTTVMPSGCWYPDLHRDKDGYSNICVNKRTRHAHRVAYEVFKGAVPHGLELDHKCRNRPCINPDHLEPVTDLENQLRSPLTPAGKTVCKHGHQDWVLYPKRGRGTVRVCGTCQREGWRKAHEKKRKHPIGGRVICKRGHAAYAFDPVKKHRYCVACRLQQCAARNERRRREAQNG